MSKRLTLLSVALLWMSLGSGCCAINSICCWHDAWLEHYQSTHYAGCGCGEQFWNPWWNDPPNCVDPCDCYGNFTGRRWWVPNCMGCRCNGCGPGGCPGVSPVGHVNVAPGPDMYPDDGTIVPQTAPSEELPVPTQSRRPRGNQRGPAPSGPSRMSRQPHYQRPPQPRVTQRRPPATEQVVRQQEVASNEDQKDGPFFDDREVSQAQGQGYRVTSSTAAYRH
ncbi:MAG TPA: hypothetical protein VMF30_17000 [Pirellulales bacterium]|nr:hypothetical protein [Pirellulales bacterium]